LVTPSASAAVSAEELPELLEDPDVLGEPPEAAELDELDEQAASASAAPAESTPIATRAFRGFRLLVLKLSMRPRIICIQGIDHTRASRVDQTTVPTDLMTADAVVNGLTNEIRSRFGHYSPTSIPAGGILSSHHIARGRRPSIGCAERIH
jgi:hypothetical protein